MYMTLPPVSRNPMRTIYCIEKQLFWFLLLAVALMIIIGFTYTLPKAVDESATFVAPSIITYEETSSPQPIAIEFEPLTDEGMVKAAESYAMQQKMIDAGLHGINNIEAVKKANSDLLPNRTFVGSSAEKMCESGQGKCVSPFVKFPTLLVASPKHRLMACLIQKSMSTVMSAIFCYLVREQDFLQAGRSILREYPDIRFCKGKIEFKNVASLLREMSERRYPLDGWRYTLVTRDPVDRFLSGFIDRCIRVGDACSGCGTNMTCFLEQEYKRAEKYAITDRSYGSKPQITMEDIHVFPQNWRCDMDVYFEKYNFIRYSNDPSETLLEDLTAILRAQGVSESSIAYISDSLRSGRTAHSNVKSAARTYLEDRIRNSSYLMETLVRLFYYDYKLFKYELPDLDSLTVA